MRVRNRSISFQAENEIESSVFNGWGIAEVFIGNLRHAFEVYRPITIPGKLHNHGEFVGRFESKAEAKRFVYDCVKTGTVIQLDWNDGISKAVKS